VKVGLVVKRGRERATCWMGYFGSFKNRTQNQAKVHNKLSEDAEEKERQVEEGQETRDETLTDWQGRKRKYFLLILNSI